MTLGSHCLRIQWQRPKYKHRGKVKCSEVSSGLGHFTSWIVAPHPQQHELASILPHYYPRHQNLLGHNEPLKGVA